MSLIPEQSSIERNRELLKAAILGGGEATHHCAAILKNWNARIWELPTEELLELLNDDVPHTLAVFQANTEIGTALNERLDQLDLPQFPTRAPVVMGRTDIEFDPVAGQFIHIPPPESVVDPESEGESTET